MSLLKGTAENYAHLSELFSLKGIVLIEINRSYRKYIIIGENGPTVENLSKRTHLLDENLSPWREQFRYNNCSELQTHVA